MLPLPHSTFDARWSFTREAWCPFSHATTASLALLTVQVFAIGALRKRCGRPFAILEKNPARDLFCGVG
jgi:hypothetical protein